MTISETERPRQLQLDVYKDKRKKITLTDPSSLLEAVSSSPFPLIVFFAGTKGIDEFFDLVQNHLKISNGDREIVALKDFFDFDDSRLGETLARMSQSDTKWILLVPEWETTGHYELIEKWADKTGAIRLEVVRQL